jgi:hypothetical protein
VVRNCGIINSGAILVIKLDDEVKDAVDSPMSRIHDVTHMDVSPVSIGKDPRGHLRHVLPLCKKYLETDRFETWKHKLTEF